MARQKHNFDGEFNVTISLFGNDCTTDKDCGENFLKCTYEFSYTGKCVFNWDWKPILIIVFAAVILVIVVVFVCRLSCRYILFAVYPN